MSWDVQHYNTRISSGEDSILKLINGLLTQGAVVYGSGDGTSFDNVGAGATNYWVSEAVVATIGSWIRLRWPSVGGVVREMAIQRTNTLHRYSVYWSSDGTGFTAGASAILRPTATDEEYTAVGTGFLVENYTFGGTVPAHYVSLITGDAGEGYSWTWMVSKSQQFGWDSSIFMDVLTDVPVGNADADPAIYGTKTQGSTEFPSSNRGDSYFSDTAINNGDDNIAGWFRKGTGSELWVCYPIIQWGTRINGITADNYSDVPSRAVELLNGAWELATYYIRSSETFATERGPKGRSRLWGITRQAVPLGVNAAGTRRHVGRGLTIPWDGSTVAREL